MTRGIPSIGENTSIVSNMLAVVKRLGKAASATVEVKAGLGVCENCLGGRETRLGDREKVLA